MQNSFPRKLIEPLALRIRHVPGNEHRSSEKRIYNQIFM